MTCIVALKHNDRIVLGSDSAISTSREIWTLKNSKIFQAGEFIIGVAGSLRVAQVLQYASFPDKSVNQSDHSYVVEMFGNYVRHLLSDAGALHKENEIQSMLGSNLIIYNNNIYVVQNDYSIMETDYPYAAVGSGETAAMSALYVLTQTLFSDKSNEESEDEKKEDVGEDVLRNMLMAALEAAAEFTVGVRAPFDTFVVTPEGKLQ